MRMEVNAKGVEKVKKNIAEETKLAAENTSRSQAASPTQQFQNSPLSSYSPLPSSLQNSPLPSTTNSPRYLPPDEIQYPTADDELELVRYYETAIFKLPIPEVTDEIRATALVFLKRFYLRNTILDYHPKMIMLASLFLAAKCENKTIGHEQFRASVAKLSQPISKEELFENELALSRSLDYEFAVHHPMKAIYGLFLDMQHYDNAQPKKNKKAKKLLMQLNEIYKQAKAFVLDSMKTDLILVYQPSQIAMGCMRMASRLHKFDFDQYLSQKLHTEFTDNDAKRHLEQLTVILDDVTQTIDAILEVSIQKAKEVDMKLKYCKNPAKNPGSFISKRKRAMEEEEREKKRARKRAANKEYQDSLELIFLDNDAKIKETGGKGSLPQK